jgi:lysophospholipase
MTIKENYHIFDGFVVLHGTDSLAYTASALSFMMADLGKPVILTGSQASIFALQSDAVDNLLGSLIIAGTFVIPEVCLFFHHTLFRGNRTTKVSASSFEAFDSPNCAPLAKVTSLGVDVNWTLVRRPTTIAGFRVTKYLDTAHVACLRIFPGIKPEMVDSVLRVPNLRGLILETFGMGNAPGGVDGSLTKVIREAVERGIVIVNVSQCTNGFVSPLYAPATLLGRAGVVFGHDLTTEAALTKLSYLLALPGWEYSQVTAEMAHSLRGEMTEMALPSFSHPAGSVDTAVGRLTSAGTPAPCNLIPYSNNNNKFTNFVCNRNGLHSPRLRDPQRRAAHGARDPRGGRVQPPTPKTRRLRGQHGAAPRRRRPRAGHHAGPARARCERARPQPGRQHAAVPR